MKFMITFTFKKVRNGNYVYFLLCNNVDRLIPDWKIDVGESSEDDKLPLRDTSEYNEIVKSVFECMRRVFEKTEDDIGMGVGSCPWKVRYGDEYQSFGCTEKMPPNTKGKFPLRAYCTAHYEPLSPEEIMFFRKIISDCLLGEIPGKLYKIITYPKQEGEKKIGVKDGARHLGLNEAKRVRTHSETNFNNKRKKGDPEFYFEIVEDEEE